PETAHDVEGSVGGGPVDHDVFQRPVTLRQNAVDRLRDARCRIARYGYDGNQWIHLVYLIPRPLECRQHLEFQGFFPSATKVKNCLTTALQKPMEYPMCMIMAAGPEASVPRSLPFRAKYPPYTRQTVAQLAIGIAAAWTTGAPSAIRPIGRT